MTQEVLKLALDTFEIELSIDWTNNDEFNASAEKMYETIAAIKQALLQPEQFCDANCVWTDHHPDCKLAQPEQKPMHPEVRKMWEDHFDKCFRDDQFDKCFRAQPDATMQSLKDLKRSVCDAVGAKALAQRTWVGLTDDEVYEIYGSVQEEVNEHWERGGTTLMFPSALYKAIEAKLKEKNT